MNLIDFDSTRGSNIGNHFDSEEEEDRAGPGVGCATS